MRWWRTHWCAIFLPILTDAFPFRARRDERGHEGRSCPVHLNLTGDALHNSPCRPLQPLLAQSIPIAEYEEKRRRKADPVSALEERREEVIHVLHRLHEASGLTLHWMQTPMPSWPAAACSSTISVASDDSPTTSRSPRLAAGDRPRFSRTTDAVSRRCGGKPCRRTERLRAGRLLASRISTVNILVNATIRDRQTACIFWVGCVKGGAKRPTFHGLARIGSQLWVLITGIPEGFSGLRPINMPRSSPYHLKGPPLLRNFPGLPLRFADLRSAILNNSDHERGCILRVICGKGALHLLGC